jgi:RES domain-containing protein
MEVFRIAKTKYIEDISGAGSKMYGARWNRVGVAALYTSEARSLALLELIVHFESKNSLKIDHSYISLVIDDDKIVNLDKSLLPTDELEINDNRLWKITDYYFFEKKVLALRVPSVLIPEESNIILNPLHVDFNQVLVKNIEPINLDERFKKLQNE